MIKSFLLRNYKSNRGGNFNTASSVEGFDYNYGSREWGFKVIQSVEKLGKFC